MEAPHLERKLIAILAADIEGYSRLMGIDEAATLTTLSAHRSHCRCADRPAWRADLQHGRGQRAGGIRQRLRRRPMRRRNPARPRSGESEAGRGSPDVVPHRHQCRRCHGEGRRYLRRRRQYRRPYRGAGRGRRDLHLPRRARPYPAQGPLWLRGSRRAEREEHRPAHTGVPPAARSADAGGGGGRRG